MAASREAEAPAAANAATSTRPLSFAGTGSSGGRHPHQHKHISRFVEGSMSDRTSTAPPVAFLGRDHQYNFAPPVLQSRDSQDVQRPIFTRHSMQAVRPFLHTSGTSASTATDATIMTSNSSRRPRSFLAPLWDGVTKRLHRRTRSTVEREDGSSGSGSSNQPVSPPWAGAAAATTASPHPPGSLDRPSPDEVLANYQQLMQAGFFTKRAIPATRQGLAGGHGRPSTAVSHAPPSPERAPPPPPPPKASPAKSPSTKASPTKAGPLTSNPARATPHGTKRGHADVESINDDQDIAVRAQDGEQNEATVKYSADSTSVRSRKLSKKQRKTPSRPEESTADEGRQHSPQRHHQLPSLPQTAVAETSHSKTRSGHSSSAATTTGHRQVQVHQALPSLPPAATSSPKRRHAATIAVEDEATGRRTLAKKRKSADQGHHERERENFYKHDNINLAAEDRLPVPSPKRHRKKRAAEAAPEVVVHQVRERTQEKANNKTDEQRDPQHALRPPPSSHYRHLAELPQGKNSSSSSGGGGGSSSSQTSPSPAGAAGTSSPPQPPISFHYPQRVRVRRAAQAQVVEVQRPKSRRSQSQDGQENRDSQERESRASRKERLQLTPKQWNNVRSFEDVENQAPAWN